MAVGYHHKVEICGVNTAKLKNLTAEEKRVLLERASQGDKQARQELIDGNLRLVLSIVQRFSGRGENLDDLFQVGCIGLIKAIDRFDCTAGVQLSTYAVPMIIGEIRRYLRDNNAIRVSRSIRDTAYKALAVRDKLQRETGLEPTVAQIAKELDMSEEDITFALEAIQDPVSLCEPIGGDTADALTIEDQVRDESVNSDTWLENIAITEAMKKLSDRERSIITMRFYRGKTQMEIADEIGISQAQVSRIEKSALERIRKDL